MVNINYMHLTFVDAAKKFSTWKKFYKCFIKLKIKFLYTFFIYHPSYEDSCKKNFSPVTQVQENVCLFRWTALKLEV